MDPKSSTQRRLLSCKKIIICGAGISGLAFAVALRKVWLSHAGPDDIPPQIYIYERETRDQARREGYSISIRSDAQAGGMQALQRLGVLDRALDLSISGRKPDAGSFTMWNIRFDTIMTIPNRPTDGLPTASMRIARKHLREALMQSLTERDVVEWGVRCDGAKRHANGKVTVHIEGGRVEECDLLIVADGSRSKTRANIRPHDTLRFANAVSIFGTAVFPDGNIPPPVDKNWGMAVSGKGTGLFVSPIDDTRALWSISYLASSPRETLEQPISAESANALLDEARQRGKAYAPAFHKLVSATDPTTLSIYNAMEKPPFQHLDENAGQIVFIGDSNHAISPFAGNGANLALVDAWDLAEQLCRASSFEAAVKAYDKIAVPRANATLRFSHFAINVAHSKGMMSWAYGSVLRLGGLFLAWASRG